MDSTSVLIKLKYRIGAVPVGEIRIATIEPEHRTAKWFEGDVPHYVCEGNYEIVSERIEALRRAVLKVESVSKYTMDDIANLCACVHGVID